MKTILIIGGSSGIGKALVELLQKDSNQEVFASYLHTEPQKMNNGVHYFPLDVEAIDTASLPALEQLDGLVYLPGTLNLKPIKRLDLSEMNRDFKINVLGAVELLKNYQSQLKGGSVVLVSSIAAQMGYSFHASISAAKGAVEGLTKSLAAEWAGITRVNCVAPSLTQTPLTAGILSTEDKIEYYGSKNPSKRIGRAKDIAQAIAFLLSDQSKYITGTILPVDGGDGTIK